MGANEKYINKFCLISKNLDKDKMITDLKASLFDGKIPDSGPFPTRKITYKLGDGVKCKVDGVVIKLWYREEFI